MNFSAAATVTAILVTTASTAIAFALAHKEARSGASYFIGSMLFVVLACFGAGASSAQNISYYYVVNTRPPDAFLALRTHPTSRQGMRVKEMPNGTLLQALQRRDDGWWYVRVVPSGEEGWTLSGQGNRKWIECCSTFDPSTDSIAITRVELDRKVSAYTNVLSEIDTETLKFISKLRCKSMEYWLLSSQKDFKISINCNFANDGDFGESSVILIYKLDASGRMVLIDKTYAG
jgi:hypothetical protein